MLMRTRRIEKAILMMKDNHVRRLIILNRAKNMVGVVSMADIATRTNDVVAKAEVIQAVSSD